MGGRPSDDPIDQSSHEWADWEHITNALVGVLRNHDLVNVDELRRGIESMTPDEYEASSYYERWSASLETLLVEKGVLTSDEIDTRAAEVDERWD
jgi:hypothetical protein